MSILPGTKAPWFSSVGFRRGELEGLGCRLVAVSQDSAVSHHRFGDIHCGFGGDFGLGFPLVEDPAGAIRRLYGVARAGAGHSPYFIIDPEQTVRVRVVGDLPRHSGGPGAPGRDGAAGAGPPARPLRRLRGRRGGEDRGHPRRHRGEAAPAASSPGRSTSRAG